MHFWINTPESAILHMLSRPSASGMAPSLLPGGGSTYCILFLGSTYVPDLEESMVLPHLKPTVTAIIVKFIGQVKLLHPEHQHSNGW